MASAAATPFAAPRARRSTMVRLHSPHPPSPLSCGVVLFPPPRERFAAAVAPSSAWSGVSRADELPFAAPYPPRHGFLERATAAARAPSAPRSALAPGLDLRFFFATARPPSTTSPSSHRPFDKSAVSAPRPPTLERFLFFADTRLASPFSPARSSPSPRGAPVNVGVSRFLFPPPSASSRNLPLPWVG